MMEYIDTHAHYDDSAFDDDRDILISSLQSKGVFAVINCACDIPGCIRTHNLTKKYSFIYGAYGIHPHECSEADNGWKESLMPFLSDPKCVAIGEIGLDYHYDFSPRDLQLSFFEEQLSVAVQNDIPVIVHDREAHEDTLNLLKKYHPRGVVHCFSGSVEMARDIVNLGMYIGLGGAVTFKNAKKPVEVASFVPDDRLLLETDCPYMTPVPFRGRRNDSSYIPYSAEVIASSRNQSVDDIFLRTTENARCLFGI